MASMKKNIIDEDLKLPFKPDLIHISSYTPQFLYTIYLKVPIIRHYCAFEDFVKHPIYKKKDNSLCNFKLNADIHVVTVFLKIYLKIINF